MALGVVVRLKAGSRTAKLIKGPRDPGRRGTIARENELKPGLDRGTVRTRRVIGVERPAIVTKSRRI